MNKISFLARLWRVLVVFSLVGTGMVFAAASVNPSDSQGARELAAKRASVDRLKSIDARTIVPEVLLIGFHSRNSSSNANAQVAAQEAASRQALHARIGSHVRHAFSLIPVHSVQIPKGMSLAEAAALYAEDPDVAYLEPNYIVHANAIPDDPRYGELWGMPRIHAPEAWNQTTGSSNILVAVIDTGILRTHVDLAANMWKNPGEMGLDGAGHDKQTNGIDDDGNGFIDDVNGWDFVNNDNDPTDDQGHGTHCAGTIGAVGNNGVGVVGVSWTVRLVALKFLGANGGSTEGAIRAVQYAVQSIPGVRLTSNSWGGGNFSQALKNAIDAAGVAGQLFIAAAGNESSDNDVSPHYPSSYTSSNIISVASITSAGGMSSFSCYGLTSVDIAAPGSGILSTWNDGAYNTISGTSMATPHVSGAAALLWSQNPSLNWEKIRDILFAGARPNPALSGKVATGGELDVAASMRQMNPPVLSQTEPRVVEGSTTNLEVYFAEAPSADTVVTVSWYSGSTNLYVVGTPALTFTVSNWFIPQTFSVGSLNDLDMTNDLAVFRMTSSDGGWGTFTLEQLDKGDVFPPQCTLSGSNNLECTELYIDFFFDEKVTGFETNDVLFTDNISGDVTLIDLSDVTGDMRHFRATFSIASSLGALTVTIPAGSLADLSGNANKNPQYNFIYTLPWTKVDFTDDMEKSPDLWTVSTNVYELITQKAWEWGVPDYIGGPAFANSGTHCWGTVLTGNYPHGMNAWVASVPIEVGPHPVLEFSLWFSTSFKDKGYVEVDGGMGFVNVTPDNEYSGVSGGWIPQRIYLNDTQFGNRTLRVRFRATSDYTNSNAGIYVDDVRVSSQKEPNVWVVDYTPVSGAPSFTVPVSFTVYNSSTNAFVNLRADVSSPYTSLNVDTSTVPIVYGNMAPGDVVTGANPVSVIIAGITNFTSPNLQLIHQARTDAGTLAVDILPFTIEGVSETLATNVLAVTSGTGVTNWMGQYLKGNSGPESCLYQVILAGPNGVPDAPALNGQVTGDDQLLYAVGTFLPWGRFGEGAGIPPDFGRFRKSFNHGAGAGTHVFVRAWDAASYEGSVAYGDSALYSLSAAGLQSYDFGSWSVGNPLPSGRDSNGDGILDAYCVTNNMDPRLPIGPLAASWSLAQAALGSAGTAPQQFNAAMPSPTRLFYKGNFLFVLDSGNNRIQIWNRLTRQYMGAYGSLGTTDGLFKKPVGLALDPSANRFAVADQGNFRIQVFSFDPEVPTNITHEVSFGSYGAGTNQFMKPTDVAIDSYGWFYITDERVGSVDESVVKIYDGYGFEFGTLASAGNGPGQVRRPGGVCVGPDDTIIVADTENSRIQAFDSGWNLMWPLSGTNTVSFSKPRGVQVGLNGRVYVADTDNSQIKILRQDGSYVATLGSQGYGFNLVMNHPYGLMPVVDSNIVYVADTFNNRVLTIAPIYDGDGDGMDDIWEELHGLNPNVNDAMLDSFGLGIPNIGVYRLGLSPAAIVVPLPVRITAFSVTPQNLQWEIASSGGIYQVEYSYDSWLIASNSWMPGPVYTSAVNGTLSVNSGLTLTNRVQYIRVKRLSP